MSIFLSKSTEKEVITSSDIQVKYEQLYHFLMEFLWEFNTVQALADLEIAVFKRFPDKEEMQRCLRELKLSISYTYNELSEDDEEEFKETFEDLEEAIENYEEELSPVEDPKTFDYSREIVIPFDDTEDD